MCRVWLLSGHRFDLEERKLAVIAIGSVERHGDHLPLGTDTIAAHYIAERTAEALGAHLYPPIWYGSSKGLKDFPGTIDISSEALYFYVKEVLKEIARNGYKVIVVVNGHGGNSRVVAEAARAVANEYDVAVIVTNWWAELARDKLRELFTHPGHAGEDETSVMLAIVPEAVDMKYAEDHIVEVPKLRAYSKKVEKVLYTNAVLGAATKASKEKGKELLKAAIDELVKFVKEIIEKYKLL